MKIKDLKVGDIVKYRLVIPKSDITSKITGTIRSFTFDRNKFLIEDYGIENYVLAKDIISKIGEETPIEEEKKNWIFEINRINQVVYERRNNTAFDYEPREEIFTIKYSFSRGELPILMAGKSYTVEFKEIED